MVLIHDTVEIDAGDTFFYTAHLDSKKQEKEQKAAERLFGLLPDDMKTEYRELWEEFEERVTPESKFANALDRIQPLMLNCFRGGIGWKEHKLKYSQIKERNKHIADGSQELWDYVLELIEGFFQNGIIPE